MWLKSTNTKNPMVNTSLVRTISYGKLNSCVYFHYEKDMVIWNYTSSAMAEEDYYNMMYILTEEYHAKNKKD